MALDFVFQEPFKKGLNMEKVKRRVIATSFSRMELDKASNEMRRVKYPRGAIIDVPKNEAGSNFFALPDAAVIPQSVVQKPDFEVFTVDQLKVMCPKDTVTAGLKKDQLIEIVMKHLYA